MSVTLWLENSEYAFRCMVENRSFSVVLHKIVFLNFNHSLAISTVEK